MSQPERRGYRCHACRKAFNNEKLNEVYMSEDSKKITLTPEQIISLVGHGATQDQLDSVRRELGDKIERGDKELESKIDKLDINIDSVHDKLDAKINKLDAKIDSVHDKLDAKIDKLDAKIDSVHDKLDAKITDLRKTIVITAITSVIAIGGLILTLFNALQPISQ